MTLNEPRWTVFSDGMPPVEDIGKVFEIADPSGRPYDFPFCVWNGAVFTGIGASRDDPNMNTDFVAASLNYPHNYWRLAPL